MVSTLELFLLSQQQDEERARQAEAEAADKAADQKRRPITKYGLNRVGIPILEPTGKHRRGQE